MVDINTILFYSNAGMVVTNLVLGSYTLYKLKESNKPISLAHIIDKKTLEVKKTINLNKNKNNKILRYKKQSYNIIFKNAIRENNITRYLFIEGEADCINISEKENSRIPSDVLDALLEENMTKKINDYVKGLPFDLEAKHVVIGLGILVGLGVFLFG